jgi:hypothetical protein
MQIIFIILVLVTSLTVNGTEKWKIESQVAAPEIEVVEQLIKSDSIVGFSWVSQPLNGILLIKTKNEYCAIKYTGYSRKGDKSESSVFKSGDESFDATIELWKPNWKAPKTIELSKRPFYGLGKIGFSPSNNRIRCGKSEFIWQYPTSTVILSKDTSSHLAPTLLNNFKDVDFEDRSLTWFGYKEGRKIKLIQME